MRVLLLACLTWGLVGGAGLVVASQHDEVSTYDSKGKCDPFVPLVQEGRLVPCGAEEPRETLVLAGIIWDSSGDPVALINNTQVGVGDAINDYQVAEIRHDAVVLMGDGEPLVLQIQF